MPNTESARKSVRQSKTRRARNIKRKQTLKILLKKVRLLISEKKAKEVKALMPEIQKTLDKSAKTHIIKKNKASRTKSRIEKAIAKIKK